MKLLLVRHAIAEEAEAFIAAGGTDAQRPLTEIGRKKMRKGANRLRALLGRIDVLAHSPLLRARETAELIARACGEPPLVECSSLDYRYPPEAVADNGVPDLCGNRKTHPCAPTLQINQGQVAGGIRLSLTVYVTVVAICAEPDRA